VGQAMLDDRAPRHARVLVIEDNPASLDLMTALLQASRCEPLTATTGEIGVEIALRERPDLVLCDIRLPGMDGFEVMRRLKEETALDGTPIVAVTALAVSSERESFLAAGFDGCLGKPLAPETFGARVRAFLEDRQYVKGGADGGETQA
jgi:two-component system, cell cycle response regulator DivK